jgi:lipid-A-disaccharide synthase
MARRIFISVGEASGDQHAAQLIRELRQLDPDIVVEGIGGPAMRAAGAIVHHDTVTRAAMGLETIFRYFELKRVLKWSIQYFASNPPDLQICIDSWMMNWHWAKLAHEHKIPVLYYIAPQVWASRPGRVKRMARYVDHVACILPFEEKFFRDHGINATFVGHPLFDALHVPDARPASARFPNQPPVIALIPGSRKSVAKRNFPQLLDVSERILQKFPQAQFLIPTMPSTHDVVKQWLLWKPGATLQFVEGGLEKIGPRTMGLSREGKNYFDEFIPQCDLCLAVSGTATLHAAALNVPMIAVYRLSPIVWNIGARWFINTRTYSLVNLLSSRSERIVPEFIPWYGSNQPVTDKALEYLEHPQLLEEQRAQLREVIGKMNQPGASRNAAKLAIELLNR